MSENWLKSNDFSAFGTWAHREYTLRIRVTQPPFRINRPAMRVGEPLEDLDVLRRHSDATAALAAHQFKSAITGATAICALAPLAGKRDAADFADEVLLSLAYRREVALVAAVYLLGPLRGKPRAAENATLGKDRLQLRPVPCPPLILSRAGFGAESSLRGIDEPLSAWADMLYQSAGISGALPGLLALG